MNNQGPLAFDATIEDVNFSTRITAMERRILGLSSVAVRETSRIDDSFRRLSSFAAGAFAFARLADLPAQLLRVRGEFQQLEIAFTTMLRSKAQANALLSDVTKFAAATPFGLKETATGAKQLLAYGFAAKDLIPTLSRLGDISAGLGLPLERLTFLYGSTKTQGRLFAQDLNQFVGSGIPLIQELAKQFGVTEDKVRGLVEEGKVGFPEVKKAIEGLTSGSGLFTGTLEAQSKSLLALRERLNDAYDRVLNDIGKKNQDIIGSMLTTATGVVENYQSVLDILQVAIATYGAYKAAVLITGVVQAAEVRILQQMAVEQSLAVLSGQALTVQQLRQAAVTKLVAQAQAGLNATMLANPVIAVVTAVAALATAYAVLKEETVEAKSAQQLLIEAGKEVNTNYQKQQSEIKNLIGIIKNQNVAESQRKIAYDRLNEITPTILNGLDLQRAKTADLTKTTNEYLVSLRRRIELEKGDGAVKKAYDQDAEAAKRLEKAQENLIKKAKDAKDAQFQPSTNMYGTGGGGSAVIVGLNEAKKELDEAVAFKKKTEQIVQEAEGNINRIVTGKADRETIEAKIKVQENLMASVNKLSRRYLEAEVKIIGYRKELQTIADAEKANQKVKDKTLDQIDAEIKAQKDLQNTTTNRAEFAKYQKQIDSLEKQRRGITGQLTTAEKKAQRDADKVGPFGSLSYYENVAKKAQEIIDKTPSTNKGELARQSAIKLDAERKAEEIRKLTAVKTFEEELEEKKRLYALYYQFVELYGQESADAQFAKLKESGGTLLDYVNAQITKLEAQRTKTGSLSEKETQNLGLLFTERDAITQQKTAIDLFRERLDKAQESADGLADTLSFLQAEQAKLNPNAGIDIDKKVEITSRIVETERELQQQLRGFLENQTGLEQQRYAVQKRYADLRLAVEKKYNGIRSQVAKDQLAEINKAEADEVKEIDNRATQASDAFKKLDEVILSQGRRALRQRLADLNAYLKSEAKAVDTQAYQGKLKERNEVALQIKSESLQDFQTFANLAGELGDQIGEANGFLGQTGKLLQGAASAAGLLSTALDESVSDTGRIAAGVQGIISIIGIVTSSAKQRKEAEAAYYASVIASQQQYNIALNEQLGIQSEINENVFTKDYAGRFNDGFKKYNDAQLNYQKALDKLEKGRAKTGQKNALDAGNIGKAVLSGAAAGAALGTIIPGIGNVVGAVGGAVVGAVAGIFGGKKKKDVFGSLLGQYPELIKKSKDGVDELNVSLAETLIANNQIDDATKQLLQSTIDWQKQMEEAKAAVRGLIQELAGQLGDKLRDSLVGAFRDGTDAAEAFRKSVTDVIEDIVTKLLFSKIFDQAFDQLGKDIEASFNTAEGGDGNLVDDFGKFFGQAEELTKVYNQGLQDFQTEAKKYGLDVLQPTATGNKNENPNSLTGAVKGVTEETASLLAGQINAIRITQAETGGLIRQQLLELTGIRLNTGTANRWLESIDNRLAKLNNDPLRGKGNPL